MENPFLAKVLKGVENEARQRNYNIIYGDSDGELKLELKFLKIMKQRKIDGIIIISANIYSSLLEKVKESEIPVVFGSGYINDPDISCVTVDNVTAAYEAVDYLVNNGHKKIGVIQGPYSDAVASAERIKGVRLAFRNHGIELDDKLIAEGDYTFESGYTGAKELLSRNNDLTAIFAFNDEMAIGAIRYLQESGISIPRDISVIGFDGIDLSKFVKPALTTVEQSGYELGSKAVEMLDSLIQGKPLSNNKIFIPHKLVERESTEMHFGEVVGKRR